MTKRITRNTSLISAITLLLSLGLMAGSAQAVSPTAKKSKCKIGLGVSLTALPNPDGTVHVDSLANWNNCKGLIAKIVVTVSAKDVTYGLTGNTKVEINPLDIPKKGAGNSNITFIPFYDYVDYLGSQIYPTLTKISIKEMEDYALRRGFLTGCQSATGRLDPIGATEYGVGVTAFSATGKKLLESSYGPVPCGQ